MLRNVRYFARKNNSVRIAHTAMVYAAGEIGNWISPDADRVCHTDGQPPTHASSLGQRHVPPYFLHPVFDLADKQQMAQPVWRTATNHRVYRGAQRAPLKPQMTVCMAHQAAVPAAAGDGNSSHGAGARHFSTLVNPNFSATAVNFAIDVLQILSVRLAEAVATLRLAAVFRSYLDVFVSQKL